MNELNKPAEGFENITPPDLNNNGESFLNFLNKIESPPPPVEVETETEAAEAAEADKSPEALKSEIKPAKSAESKKILSPGEVSRSREITANMIMKGFNALFAFVAIIITKKPENFERYKVGENEINELSDLFNDLQTIYNWNISPLIPFIIGFGGFFGAKGYEIYSDLNSAPADNQSLQSEREKLNAEIELNELRNKARESRNPAKAAPVKSNRGVKPGTKRGSYKKSK